ncbi:hypothetical protein BGZ83_002606 [Gryganskiella cystojenkinii]|nr:hypothetical protein BGZ83_002606 [Gryganskiella cystojenkinii]
MNLVEIRFMVADYLDRQNIARCARVSKDWGSTFLPLLYKNVHCPSNLLVMKQVTDKALERHGRHIKTLSLDLPRSALEKIASLGKGTIEHLSIELKISLNDDNRIFAKHQELLILLENNKTHLRTLTLKNCHGEDARAYVEHVLKACTGSQLRKLNLDEVTVSLLDVVRMQNMSQLSEFCYSEFNYDSRLRNTLRFQPIPSLDRLLAVADTVPHPGPSPALGLDIPSSSSVVFPNLKILDLKFTQECHFSHLVFDLAACSPQLEKLALEGQVIHRQDDIDYRKLKINPKLTSLRLVLTALDLATLFIRWPNLKDVHLEREYLSKESLEPLRGSGHAPETVTSLFVDEAEQSALLKNLESLKSLENLVIRDFARKVPAKDMTHIPLKAWSGGEDLACLWGDPTQFGQENGNVLCEMIKTWPRLKNVSLSPPELCVLYP